MATDKPKFTVIVDTIIDDLIEEYRHKYKMRSKSAAAAKLIEIGLQHEKLLEQKK